MGKADAKELLNQYEDREGHEPPEGLTAAGKALWLMQKKGSSDE